MYETFKQMTDEQLLAIVNLKTGSYTHDELQAAREEFIRRMYSEPLILPREEALEESVFVENKPQNDDDLKLEKPIKFIEEYGISVPKLDEEPTVSEPAPVLEEVKISPDASSFEPKEDLETTRAYTPAQVELLEKAEQQTEYDTPSIFDEVAAKFTEEDYAFYERAKPQVFCEQDTPLAKFCRRFVMPLISVKVFITLLISLLGVISDFTSLAFNVYTSSALISLIAITFAYDALVNDINPILPKLVLSSELMLTLFDLMVGRTGVSMFLAMPYIIILILGIVGLFPKQIK